MPPLEPTAMPVLNIEESDFLERTKKLLEKDNKWETHIAEQVPLSRSSFPYLDNNQPRSLEQPEPKTGDAMDVRDFSERPMNDRRPPKPAHKPKVMLQTLFPPPPGLPRLQSHECCSIRNLKTTINRNQRDSSREEEGTLGMANMFKEVTPKSHIP